MPCYVHPTRKLVPEPTAGVGQASAVPELFAIRRHKRLRDRSLKLIQAARLKGGGMVAVQSGLQFSLTALYSNTTEASIRSHWR